MGKIQWCGLSTDSVQSINHSFIYSFICPSTKYTQGLCQELGEEKAWATAWWRRASTLWGNLSAHCPKHFHPQKLEAHGLGSWQNLRTSSFIHSAKFSNCKRNRRRKWFSFGKQSSWLWKKNNGREFNSSNVWEILKLPYWCFRTSFDSRFKT